MPKVTPIVFRGLGFDTQPPESLLSTTTSSQTRLFRLFRLFFGWIWLYDAWTVSSGANKHAIAQFMGLPFSSTLVHLAGTGILILDLYIALALLSGKGMRSALWIGIVYLLAMWIGVEHGGGFNPDTGATDAGISPAYLIALIFTYVSWRISQPLSASQDDSTRGHTLLWCNAARVLFGCHWAWDTLFKLRPYFVTHFVSFLAGAEAKEPAWMIGYLHVWIALVTHTSPILFGVLAALAEVVITWSLLSGKLLRIILPFGLVYSLMVWSTAEGLGGPYGNGSNGMPGNMFGNAIIYALIFGYLMVLYRWPKRLDQISER
jgi:hypothetical protein